MTMRTQSKKPPAFLIGKDCRGNWVAQKQHGCCGGLFVSHATALKFALIQNGNRPDAVITVHGVLELDFGGAANRSRSDAERSHPAPGSYSRNLRSPVIGGPIIAQAA
jgi:hypothetical protein